MADLLDFVARAAQVYLAIGAIIGALVIAALPRSSRSLGVFAYCAALWLPIFVREVVQWIRGIARRRP